MKSQIFKIMILVLLMGGCIFLFQNCVTGTDLVTYDKIKTSITNMTATAQAPVKPCVFTINLDKFDINSTPESPAYVSLQAFQIPLTASSQSECLKLVNNFMGSSMCKCVVKGEVQECSGNLKDEPIARASTRPDRGLAFDGQEQSALQYRVTKCPCQPQDHTCFVHQ